MQSYLWCFILCLSFNKEMRLLLHLILRTPTAEKGGKDSLCVFMLQLVTTLRPRGARQRARVCLLQPHVFLHAFCNAPCDLVFFGALIPLEERLQSSGISLSNYVLLQFVRKIAVYLIQGHPLHSPQQLFLIKYKKCN